MSVAIMASEESSVPDPRLMEAQMHGSFFDNLVSTIPARAYLREVSEVDRIKSSRFMQNKKGKAPKQDIKEASKKGKRSAVSHTITLNSHGYEPLLSSTPWGELCCHDKR
eukprot:TRINITY_DN9430_c0_g1_i2.p3 TRINITY_DN9430_c0_g1~~TRINITY_DN9430_c0_g1_i2.p3  ORF type:complete len:110 (+),score=15.39 TRINITY_DN9430_c0_g1_i2:106-435(+)